MVGVCTCQDQSSSSNIREYLLDPKNQSRLSDYSIGYVRGQLPPPCEHQKYWRSLLCRSSGVAGDSDLTEAEEQTGIAALNELADRSEVVNFEQYNESCITVEVLDIPDPENHICRRLVAIPIGHRHTPALVTNACHRKHRSLTWYCHQCPKAPRKCMHVAGAKRYGAVDDSDDDDPPRAEGEKRDDKYNHKIDPETGKMLSSCFSKETITDPMKMSLSDKNSMRAKIAKIIHLHEQKKKVYLPSLPKGVLFCTYDLCMPVFGSFFLLFFVRRVYVCFVWIDDDVEQNYVEKNVWTLVGPIPVFIRSGFDLGEYGILDYDR